MAAGGARCATEAKLRAGPAPAAARALPTASDDEFIAHLVARLTKVRDNGGCCERKQCTSKWPFDDSGAFERIARGWHCTGSASHVARNQELAVELATRRNQQAYTITDTAGGATRTAAVCKVAWELVHGVSDKVVKRLLRELKASPGGVAQAAACGQLHSGGAHNMHQTDAISQRVFLQYYVSHHGYSMPGRFPSSARVDEQRIEPGTTDNQLWLEYLLMRQAERDRTGAERNLGAALVVLVDGSEAPAVSAGDVDAGVAVAAGAGAGGAGSGAGRAAGGRVSARRGGRAGPQRGKVARRGPSVKRKGRVETGPPPDKPKKHRGGAPPDHHRDDPYPETPAERARRHAVEEQLRTATTADALEVALHAAAALPPPYIALPRWRHNHRVWNCDFIVGKGVSDVCDVCFEIVCEDEAAREMAHGEPRVAALAGVAVKRKAHEAAWDALTTYHHARKVEAQDSLRVFADLPDKWHTLAGLEQKDWCTREGITMIGFDYMMKVRVGDGTGVARTVVPQCDAAAVTDVARAVRSVPPARVLLLSVCSCACLCTACSRLATFLRQGSGATGWGFTTRPCSAC